MWIWIGLGLCGIWAFTIMWRGWGICFNGRYQVVKLIESVGCFVLGPIGLIFALIIVGKYYFRRTKMKIYWDEKLQQIKTRGGECIYDKNREGNTSEIVELRQEYSKAINKLETQAKQLQCSAKTQGKHKMVFNRLSRNIFRMHEPILLYGAGVPLRQTEHGTFKFYIFKCSICDLEITKTEKELSAIEKEALKKLKLL